MNYGTEHIAVQTGYWTCLQNYFVFLFRADKNCMEWATVLLCFDKTKLLLGPAYSQTVTVTMEQDMKHCDLHYMDLPVASHSN